MAAAAPAAAGALRDQLKVALTDAKGMFDEGLIDQQEYGELKAHELRKYKTALASLNAIAVTDASPPPSLPPIDRRLPSIPERPQLQPSSFTRAELLPHPVQPPGWPTAAPMTPREAALAVADAWGGGDGTGLVTPERRPPLPLSVRHAPSERGDPGAAAAAVFSATAAAQLTEPDNILSNPDVYERLRTPPIFRRRSATARRTVVLSGTEVDKLRQEGVSQDE
jgi:hypothetical protein